MISYLVFAFDKAKYNDKRPTVQAMLSARVRCRPFYRKNMEEFNLMRTLQSIPSVAALLYAANVRRGIYKCVKQMLIRWFGQNFPFSSRNAMCQFAISRNDFMRHCQTVIIF